jgi:hypothetical protein
MGIEEIVLLVAGQQFSQALAAYLAKIGPGTTNVYAAAAIAVGQQLAANAAKGCAIGLTAATSEFSNTQSNESVAATALLNLPTIK